MPKKTDPLRRKILKIRFSLPNHWKLEQWAEDNDMGKIEAANKILDDFLKKNVKLEVEA